MKAKKYITLIALALSLPWFNGSGKIHAQTVDKIYTITRPTGQLTPKSIRHNGYGIFSAQNMMYNHSISFYDRSFNLLKVLKDSINLSTYGICDKDEWYRGAPVECDYSSDGRFAYVSNYKMYGKGFEPEAYDNCYISDKNEKSYIYKVSLDDFSIINIYEVGSVPKYVLYLDKYDWLAVSNWCSGTISIINTKTEKLIKEIYVGTYPRGLAQHKNHLYATVMGSNYITKINLNDFSQIEKIIVGNGPRDIRIDNNEKYMYITLNNENSVAQLNLNTKQIEKKLRVGSLPRSMCIDSEGEFIYFTLYGSHEVGRIKIPEMTLIPPFKTCYKPIGIEYDQERNQLWVACYGGAITIYNITKEQPTITLVQNSPLAIKNDAKKVIRANIEPDPDYSTIVPSLKKASITKKKNHKYLLVSGSFNSESNAKKRQKHLKSIGVVATIAKTKTHYRVHSYSGNNLKQLEKTRKTILNNLNIESWYNKP